MPLAAGQSLTHYEILGPLGAGGMGEVYRAKDTRLEREVAIKVLPEELADDEERLRRFEREAKTLASLNHQNVAGIHGIDQVDDTCFLAMELVAGEDLAAKLARGPLPVDEALDVCRQIAEGLEAAHEAGVVHRDLKPANVRITPGGVVKILDFGLAKPIHREAGKGGATAAESDSFLLTEEGLVLGTPTYMSPEQARGKPVDRRTDIWAFGCVLFECLTGKRAFGGDSLTDILAAIVGEEPDMKPLAGTPRHVRALLARCLTKDPRERLRDIGEARVALQRGGPAEPDSAAPVSPRGSRRLPFVARCLAAGALLGLGALGGWWWGAHDQAPVESWSRFTQLTDLAGAETGPAMSPDGSSFAYASQAAGSWDVYVQRVGGRNATPVAADPERDEAWPAFSPDGRLIAYNESDEDGGIWIVGATGESARRVTDFGFNPTWSPDGEHLAFVTEETLSPYSRPGLSTLWRVPATGGVPVQLSDLDAMQPAWSPSGERLAIWFQEGGQRDLATVPAEGGERLVLLEDAPLDWSPTWSPDGRYLYFSSDRGGSMGLWRLAVDEASGRPEGVPEPLMGGLEGSISLPSSSRDGRWLAFRSETISVNPVVIPFDPESERAGRPRELLRRTGILRPAHVSPDGEWLALFNLGERQEDLFLMRTDGSELRRLTDDLARDRWPRFSSDGELLAFYSNRGGDYSGYSIRVDGSALSPLFHGPFSSINSVMFEPAGDRLLGIYDDPKRAFLASPPWPCSPSAITELEQIHLPDGDLCPIFWSPDGSRISGPLLGSSGGLGAGVGIYDLTTRKAWQVSTDPGIWLATWLPDNQRVIYFTRDGELVVIDVETTERRVIPVELPFLPALEAFAVAPDGKALYYGAERVESNIWMVERGR